MSNFSDNWVGSEGPGFRDRIKGSVRPAGALKPRLEMAVRQIQMQVSKLDAATTKLKERDSSIFNRVVSSIQKHDTSHAAVYANELAEVRKMNRMVTQAKLALEQIVLRLNTVRELGDIVVTLSPAMSVIKNVQSGLTSVLPEADHEIGEIGGLLSGLLVDAGQLGGYTINFDAANEESEKILSEASTIAEQRLKDKFPDLPADVQESAGSISLG